MTQLANGNLLVVVTQLFISVFVALELILVGNHCQCEACEKKKPGIYLDVITVLWIEADLFVELMAKRNGKSFVCV